MVYHAAVAPALGVVMAVLFFVTMIGVGIIAAALGAPGLAAMSIGQIAGAAVVLLVNRRHGGTRTTIFGYTPTLRHLAAGVLLGVSLWYINLWLVLVLRAPTSAPGLEKATTQLPLAPTLVLLTLVPAVCEEMIFRGVLARSFATRLPAAAAIALSAVVFSAYHMNVAQMLPAFLLGLALAFLALRARSILPGMITHALNNAMAILISRDAFGLGAILRYPAATLAVMVAIAVIGLASARRLPHQMTSDPR